MKKILFITAFPPCGKTGGQIFSYNAIKELSLAYKVAVFYFSFPRHCCEIEETSMIETVMEFPTHIYNIFRYPLIHPTFTKRFNMKIARYLQSIASQYDILYFDFAQVALYSLYIIHPCKFLRLHDVLAQKYLRRNILLGTWIRKTEDKILKSFNKIFVPSVKDMELLKNLYQIDAVYTNEYLRDYDFTESKINKKQFVFYGYWKRKENSAGLIWFLENVYPLIKNDKYMFYIIGSGLSRKIQKKYLDNLHFEYLDFCDEPLAIIAKSTAVIVPLFQGAGIKVKVLDAFTVGTPVIGTDIAFEGIPNITGLSFLCSTPGHFVDNMRKLSEETDYDRKILAKQFKNIYDRYHLLERLVDVLEDNYRIDHL